MKRKAVSATMLTLLLMGMLNFAVNVHLAEAGGTIYIRPDGSVDPSTVPIQRVGDVYTFTDDIYNMSIEVQRDNIKLDGNDHLLQGPKEFRNYFAIYLRLRKDVTIANVVLSSGFTYGIWLDSSSNNKIINNTILLGIDYTYGIKLFWSNHNILINNTVMNTYEAVTLEYSSFNTLSSNKVIDGFWGIQLWFGRENTLRNNVMAANRYNFGVGNIFLGYYLHDVDTSNTIDGKPVYYWLNHDNETVPLDAGHVVIVDSSRITVKNLKLTNNWYGVILAYTRNSLIENVTATGNRVGIGLDCSDYNVITKNNLTANNGPGIFVGYSDHNILTYNSVVNNNASGIWLEDTKNNTVMGNSISYSRPGFPQECDGAGILVDDSIICNVTGNNATRNKYGIVVGANWSVKNLIVRNNIEMNDVGLILFDARYNTVYHNNFMENKLQQVRTYMNSRSTFDSGYPSGGNFWSDYMGADEFSGPYQNEIGSDGIGDTPYVIDEDNQDNYPLMKPWTPTPPVITAAIDIDPDTLNLKSKGKWITAYIELPEGYNVSDIDRTTILLNDTIPVDPFWSDKPPESVIGDHDEDGIPDLMVKFDRAEVIEFIFSATGLPNDKFTCVAITFTGKLIDETPFECNATIRNVLHNYRHASYRHALHRHTLTPI